MSGGPLTTWRCSDCGHEFWNQVTAGGEFGVSVQVLACPDPGCPGTPEIVALDDVAFHNDPSREAERGS